MYIIVGLGNPGEEYKNTRHNCGFMTLDKVAEKLNVQINKAKHKAITGETKIGDEKILLVKPMTYMNLSGDSISEIMNFYKVPLENLIVIFDDLDIPVGTMRIKNEGSAGTHNGMRSVVSKLGSENFKRIKVGIGSNNVHNLINFVTGEFNKEEKELIEMKIDDAADAAIMIIEDSGNTARAMNKYN